MSELDELKNQINTLKLENQSLKEENIRLRTSAIKGSYPQIPIHKPDDTEILRKMPVKPDLENPPIYKENINQQSPNESKILLFRTLFKGREDVYPVRWETRNGKSGYSPVCANEWDRKFCRKPVLKCSECENKKYSPLTAKVISDHLSGKITAGVYPMLLDEKCNFLACDFDESKWQDDAYAFIKTCRELNIPAYLERSRSGNGGHIWIFFEAKIPAFQARKLGFIILTKTMDSRHQIGLSSYDRFFPNQDTMPKGGFGNLIALPLQYKPRMEGNSVFINESFETLPDQWAFLSQISKNTHVVKIKYY